MRKIFASFTVVSGALLLLGCPRFHSECQGGEWSSTVVSTRTGTDSGGNSRTDSTTDRSTGCKYWLCRDGYLRQAGSCVETCDDTEYVASGRWCIRKCPKGQLAKDDECVASCGKGWFVKEPENQCVEWCETGYVLEGDKCVKPPQEARSQAPRSTL
ncbi:MAG: hypothetical protein SFV15_07260 [Polyangiaceae bacterium]|nr:hypothetical protein [Polyangiaceae bacterium]